MKGEGDVVTGKNKVMSTAALFTPADVLAEAPKAGGTWISK